MLHVFITEWAGWKVQSGDYRRAGGHWKLAKEGDRTGEGAFVAMLECGCRIRVDNPARAAIVTKFGSWAGACLVFGRQVGNRSNED